MSKPDPPYEASVPPPRSAGGPPYLEDCVQVKKCSHVAHCPFPACLDMDFKPVVEDHDQAYHGECTTCSPGDFSNTDLCLSCQNLRLRHLLLCTDMRKWSFIHFGKIEDIHRRTDCKLCSVVSSVIHRFWRVTGLTAGSGPDEICTLGTCHYDEFPDSALLLRIVVPPAPGEIDWERVGYIHIQFEDLHIEPLPEEGGPYQLLRYDYRKFYSVYQRTPSRERRFCPTPLVGAKIHWASVNEWLNVCTRNHNCIRAGPHNISGLRVIDVHKRCITTAPLDCRYVALSYVWGKGENPKLQATLANLEDLQKPGGLASDRLEHTIDDAIRVCTELGERYLWVDRLCIVQDDTHSKQGSIESMDEIYSSAYLMIVAASGDDADYGLPGVHHKFRSNPQISRTVQQMEITEMMRIFGDTVPLSTWSKRGWTYQEWLLAPRALVFTEEQTYLTCQEVMHFEDACVGKFGDLFNINWWYYWSPQEIRNAPDPLYEYAKRLKEYSTRELSHGSDAFNAFAGVAHAIYQGRQKSFLFGLPESDFHEALLWDPRPPYRAREDAEFPSWSWMSHEGKIDAPEYQGYWCGPLTRWFAYNAEQQALLPLQVARTLTAEDFQKADNGDFQRYLKLAEDTLDVPRLVRESAYDELTPLLPLSKETVALARQDGRIVGRVQTALFKLKDESALDSSRGPSGAPLAPSAQLSRLKGLTLVNLRGNHVGYVAVPMDWAAANLGSAAGGPENLFECICLSVSSPRSTWAKRFRYQVEHNLSDDDNTRHCQESNSASKDDVNTSEYKEEGDESSIGEASLEQSELSEEHEPLQDIESLSEDYPNNDDRSDLSEDLPEREEVLETSDIVLTVMLVGWRGHVAHRIGSLGGVFLDRWVEAQPTWKTVILE